MKRLNIKKATHHLKSQILRITVFSLITLLICYLAFICVQYLFFTVRCNIAEASGNETYWVSGYQTKNHWDDPDVVENYKNAVAEKKAFIDSNLIAGFISSLNRNWVCKIFQYAFVIGVPVVAVFALFCEAILLYYGIPDVIKRYLKIRKAQKEENSRNGKGSRTSSQKRSRKEVAPRHAKDSKLHRIFTFCTAIFQKKNSALSKKLL